jgi:hypothetical protein
MGFLNKFLPPRDAGLPSRDVQVLTLAPAVMRMSIAGKDATTELDALAAAVAKLGRPEGFSAERVFASATELVRMIKAGGVAGLTDKMKADLAPEERSDAMRLALAAMFCLPLHDSGDIGILAGMAQQIDISDARFEALFEEAKALV